MFNERAPLVQNERSVPWLVLSVELNRHLTSGDADLTELHLGMDDAPVPLRNIAPPLAAVRVNRDGMEESRVRVESLGDDRANVLREGMQSWSDPSGRRHVPQPPEPRAPGRRGASVRS